MVNCGKGFIFPIRILLMYPWPYPVQQQKQGTQVIIHAVIIAVLLIGALFLATRFGLISCAQIPFWCDGYHFILSKVLGRPYPLVLLVYGDSGMGNPQYLSAFLENQCNLHVDTEPLAAMSAGNLSHYDVVIVEHARTMNADQMRMLWDYVAKGGKLLFVGDSGTVSENPAYYVYVGGGVPVSTEANHARSEGGDSNSLVDGNRGIILNPWDRYDSFGRLVLFGKKMLGLQYVGNICSSDGKPSDSGEPRTCSLAGRVLVYNDTLTSGLPTSFSMNCNFAVVKDYGFSVFGPHTTLLAYHTGAPFRGVQPPYPILVRTGYRIVYSAFPPECLLQSENTEMRGIGYLLMMNLCRWMST